MKLHSVSVKRFRSINHADVADCGQFNVLIGKNNTGKSNILTAIDTFFSCVRNGVITLDPAIGRDNIDFFERNTDAPIEITLVFRLELAERDALIRDVVTEAPQMRNAVDGIDPSLRLATTVTVTPPPFCFGYVSKVSLRPASDYDGEEPPGERTLLAVPPEAASELHEQSSSYAQASQDINTLTRLQRGERGGLERYWKNSKSEGGSLPLRVYLREITQVSISNKLLQTLEAALEKATSLQDFTEAVKVLMNNLEEAAAKTQEEPLRSKVLTFAGEESFIPRYIRNLLGLLAELKVLHLKDRREPIGREEAKKLLALKVRRGGPEVLSQLQDTVSSLLGVKIDAFQGAGVPGRLDSTAEMDVDNFLVEVNGSGVREALRVILDVQFSHPSILLVEEPEIHLHPALEISMMHYLKRTSVDCQVFITTHSTNFLDSGELRNVYLVSKSDSTRIQLLNVDEAESRIPVELGIRLSSLFMFDRLVFVEGPSDEGILREWADKLGINLAQSNVGFISMGGVRNFAHFANSKTISFLSKRQVRIWFILDRDEKDETEVSALCQKLGAIASIKVLQKREIENYLVQPRAILAFLQLRRGKGGQASGTSLPSESELSSVITDCANSLKQVTVAKRLAKATCRPVCPVQDWVNDGTDDPATLIASASEALKREIENLAKLQTAIPDLWEKHAAEVDKVWSTHRLSLVPGDLLLDKVCQRYGVRFKKERDSALLASLMTADEIDSELKTILNKLVS